MTTETKDNQRGNIHTGILQIKIVLDGEKVVGIESQHITECYFIEDIFSSCMMGRLSFIDEYGAYEFGPFTGNEIVSIRYGRIEQREVVFRVLRVEKIIQRNTTSPQVSPHFVLDLADITFEKFVSSRFSRSFGPKEKHTDAVKHIIRNMIGWNDNKHINIMDSTSELGEPFCIPYWTPRTAISWLLGRAHSGSHYGYLCYANTYNRHSINAIPITYLLSTSNTTDEVTYTLESNKGDKDSMSLNNKILEWWVDGIDHSLTRTIRNTNVTGFDITRKKLLTQNITFDDGIKHTPVLGEYALFNTNYGTSDEISYIDKGTGHTTLNDLKKEGLNDFVRKYAMMQLMNIMVIGNEKRYAGHQIYVDWSSVNQQSATKNRLFDGPYLVKSITHDFVDQNSPIGYTQRMVLIKNGFQKPTTKSLKKSRILNTSGGVKSSEFKIT